MCGRSTTNCVGQQLTLNYILKLDTFLNEENIFFMSYHLLYLSIIDENKTFEWQEYVIIINLRNILYWEFIQILNLSFKPFK